jgi:hypothetical protein
MPVVGGGLKIKFKCIKSLLLLDNLSFKLTDYYLIKFKLCNYSRKLDIEMPCLSCIIILFNSTFVLQTLASGNSKSTI